LPIRIVSVGAGNVAVARNATLEAARGDWFLLVDDDERVGRDWIVPHLNVAAQYDADAVFGPVYPVYPETTPLWFRRADPMFHDLGWADTGRQITFGQSGNTLVRAATVHRLGLRFDPAFGRTGGEDDDFFRRMAAQGARLVITDRAKAWEAVPAERTTARYTLERMTRTGRIYARAVLRGAAWSRRLVFALDAAAKLGAASLAAMLLRPLDRARAFRMRMKMSSNIGKLQALLGGRPTDAWKAGS
jgi:succinoglycan biosynthesis protein ExoM